MPSNTPGSAPYSPILASVGIGTGMVGTSSRSTSSNNPASAPLNFQPLMMDRGDVDAADGSALLDQLRQVGTIFGLVRRRAT
jgi:hypothetical protein